MKNQAAQTKSFEKHGFEDLSPAFNLLKIENSVLEISSFRNIASASDTINNLLLFLKKFKTYYPNLFAWGEKIEVNKEIKIEVDNVIDRFGEIRDNASDTLHILRKQIQAVKGKGVHRRAVRRYSRPCHSSDPRVAGLWRCVT